MKSSANDISLLDELRTGGYEASLITTYNVYLPFYEEVVLRKLLASGCRHNVVLADHEQCALAVRDTNYRPGLAGTQYTLVPMRVPGSFHPKIAFLAGPKKVLILVGSHNLTVSGFSYNRELTNRIEILKGGDPDSLRLAAKVWQTLSAWLHDQEDFLPEELIKAALSVRDPAGWLKTEGESTSSPLLASTPGHQSLWEQVKPFIKQRTKKVAIVGPFFDEDFSFVRQIAEDIKPSEIAIGVEPETVSLGNTSRLGKIASLVDASFLHKRSGYLHAKALLLELKSGEHILATGSANPGFSAWLSPGVSRNAEAILVQTGKRATTLATQLGLVRLFERSPLSRDKLKEIESRSTARRKAEEPTSAPIAVAVETNEGFRVLKSCVSGKFREARLLDERRQSIKTIARPAPSKDSVVIAVPDAEMRSKTHEIELVPVTGPATLLLVHHTEAIRSRAQSSRQVQFRTALASLNGEYPDLAALISTVEKIIFDEKVELAPPPRISGKKAGPSTKPTPRPETLGVNRREIESRSKSHRLIRSGDLGYLLDALIHRLGIGLDSPGEQVDRLGRSEEEQRGQDDDNNHDIPGSLNDHELAAICRRKVRTLVNRMIRQLERAATTDSDPTLFLVQLVAVLATLRELRSLENHSRWSSLREVLVPEEDRYELLGWSMTYLYGRKYRLIERALKAMASDARLDEVSRMQGLLLWLAWDCGVKLEEGRLFGEEPEETYQRVSDKAILLALAPSTSQDNIAVAEAEESVLRTSKAFQLTSATEWLAKHIGWGKSLSSNIERFTKLPRKPGRPEPGDLAYATSLKEPFLSVVRSSSDGYVCLADLSSDTEEVCYVADKVAAIQL